MWGMANAIWLGEREIVEPDVVPAWLKGDAASH
jgi:hypothetical protein